MHKFQLFFLCFFFLFCFLQVEYTHETGIWSKKKTWPASLQNPSPAPSKHPHPKPLSYTLWGRRRIGHADPAGDFSLIGNAGVRARDGLRGRALLARMRCHSWVSLLST
jgi:hypothetical protein